MNALGTNPGIIVLLPGYYYSESTTIDIYTGQAIISPGGRSPIIHYTGTGTAIEGAKGATRYHIKLMGFSLICDNDNSIGIDLSTISFSQFEFLSVKATGDSGYPYYGANPQSGASPHYNVFINCQATIDSGIGFYMDDSGTTQASANSNIWLGGRVSGTGNTAGTGFQLEDGNNNIIEGLWFESLLNGIKLADINGSYCFSNIIIQSRFESMGTCIDIGSSVAYTQIFGGAFSSYTNKIVDNGDSTQILIPGSEIIAGADMMRLKGTFPSVELYGTELNAVDVRFEENRGAIKFLVGATAHHIFGCGGGSGYDHEIGHAGAGVIVKTPDGSARYRISVDNNGNIISTKL